MIPTLNRPIFVERLLRYYASQNFRGRLLVGDSSAPENARRCRAAVASVAGQIDVKYIELYDQDCNASMAALAESIDTPYAAYIGDDDFIIPAALEEAVAFLDEHPDYVSASGQARNFVLREDGALGEAVMKGPYPQRAIENDTALGRLGWLLFEYTPTIFAVHRTEAWKAMWRQTATMPDRTFGSELLPCCLSVVLGKAATLDCLYLMRQAHQGTYHLPGRLDWYSSPAWGPSYQIFLNTLADHISHIDGISKAEAVNGVKRWFDHYLHGDRTTMRHRMQRAHYQLYHGFLPQWRRIQEHHPMLATLLRQLNLGARRAYRLIASPTEGIGKRLSDGTITLMDAALPSNRKAIKDAARSLENERSLS